VTHKAGPTTLGASIYLGWICTDAGLSRLAGVHICVKSLSTLFKRPFWHQHMAAAKYRGRCHYARFQQSNSQAAATVGVELQGGTAHSPARSDHPTESSWWYQFLAIASKRKHHTEGDWLPFKRGSPKVMIWKRDKVCSQHELVWPGGLH
jgi:hypothetical protein